MPLLVATDSTVLVFDVARGVVESARGLNARAPTCLAAVPGHAARAWCGTDGSGVYATEDGGASWTPAGLEGRRITALAAGSGDSNVLWAGTEPSQVWRSGDGRTWRRTAALEELPSSSGWSFPPRPETHHVRWIASDPQQPERLWVAVEAGALVSTEDGGESWMDRVPGSPRDTHELAIHPDQPDTLRVSAGDGYFESRDGGATWASPEDGLDARYLRSVAIDPVDSETVLVSAAPGPRTAYVAGTADGRVYRRSGAERWQRVVAGWPEPPDTIAPLLRAGVRAGELWAADERGVHRTEDGGATWRHVAAYPERPSHLRGLVLLDGQETWGAWRTWT